MDTAPIKTKIELRNDSALLTAITRFNHQEAGDAALMDELHIASTQNLPCIWGFNEKMRRILMNGCPELSEHPPITEEQRYKLELLAVTLLKAERKKVIDVRAFDILQNAPSILRALIPIFQFSQEMYLMQHDLAALQLNHIVQSGPHEPKATHYRTSSNVVALTNSNTQEDPEQRFKRAVNGIERTALLINTLEQMAKNIECVATSSKPFAFIGSAANDNIKARKK